MTMISLFVREVGDLKPYCALEFDLPEVPKPGTYISIYRGGPAGNQSEDMVVEKVCWQLKHPSMGAFGSKQQKIGSLIEVVVECSLAIGPHSSERWRDKMMAHRDKGVAVAEFSIASFGASERRR
jgi:hypothetical protein